MLKSVVFLKFFAALLQGIAIAFQPVTENNHVLVGRVFQQLYARDWFNCIQACHDEPRCISYNYERSADANGLCELNDCGVEGLCDRDKSLIYSVGFVFQQLREGKVSFTDNKLIIKLPSGHSGVSVFVTEVLLVVLSGMTEEYIITCVPFLAVKMLERVQHLLFVVTLYVFFKHMLSVIFLRRQHNKGRLWINVSFEPGNRQKAYGLRPIKANFRFTFALAVVCIVRRFCWTY